MADITNNLKLPYLAAGQAQKHVTHNEALRMLDALAQLSVLDKDLTAPPNTPVEGAAYLIPAAATGAWAGRTGQVAVFADGFFSYFIPKEGWETWVCDEDQTYIFNGSQWIMPSLGASAAVNLAPMLGVTASADATNRLSVKANAVLLSHDDVTPGTGNLQVKLNKKVVTATGTVLFQTNWSGRAEIGTMGDDKFRIKVSADGATWRDALTVDPATGRVGINQVAPTTELDVTGTARVAGTLLLADSTQRVNATTAVSYLNYYKVGDVGRSISLGFDPAARALAIGRWNTTTDAFVGNLVRYGNDGTVQYFVPPRPATDNTTSCGLSTARWNVVFAVTGTINTSDKRLKTDITACPLGLDFVQALQPKLYRWKEGAGAGENGAAARPGKRLHAGFLAQEVKAALDAAGVDCGLFVQEDPQNPQSTQSLRYDQLIAPLVTAVQELAARVERLEAYQAG